MVLIERPSAKEESFNIASIKSRRLGISISERDLCNLDISKLKKELSNHVDYDVLSSYNNDSDNIVDLILM